MDNVVRNLNQLMSENPQQAKKVWWELDSPDIDLLVDETNGEEYFQRRVNVVQHQDYRPRDKEKKKRILELLERSYETV